ncbi:heparinase II/III family protein [Leisingera sp. SS27]|uniref:heparinase II/III family protein n=1 Tax=Leisingera sp. SS27 TaxID=2979462 RepID=UPI00232B38A7|nr:heparinase II/III family protein [Leisingera sp. SS27]MDC0660360.1 heparinase II/III family protein [Leisingera sp. SS27]
MSKLRKMTVLLRAASRLSPRMAAYMLRRLLRNRLAPRFPQAYRNRIGRIARGLPLPVPPAGVTPGLAEVAEFYCAEYRGMVAGVPRGKMRFHGRTVDFGAPQQVDWNHRVAEEGDHQMWRVKLAHMGFLCPMLLEGGAEQGAAARILAEGALAGTDMAAPGAFSGYWFPYAASHRLLAVGAALLAGGSRVPPETAAALSRLLQLNAAFVLDNIEHELCNNHVERNLAGLCLYFSHVPEVPAAVAARLERDIARLLRATILEDGTQIERSPMYQGLSLVSLAVMAEAPFLTAGLRRALADRLSAARTAFAALCHPDGKVALFNDCWHGEVPVWTGAPAPDGRILLPGGGYGRLAQGDDLCVMDAGPLGPRWNPGHGHADFLSLEISLGGQRLLVDPGTSRYNTGPERAYERSAAAHNGPAWSGYEPADFLGCFKVGRTAAARLVPGSRLPEDAMAGLFRSRPGQVARAVRIFAGRGFLIADRWSGSAPGSQVAWRLPGEWQPLASEEGWLFRHGESGRTACIMALTPVAPAKLEAGHWAHHYGGRDPAHVLRLRPQPQERTGQQLLTWVGHEAPEEHIAAAGETLMRHLAGLMKSA